MQQTNLSKEEHWLRFIQRQLKVPRNYIIETLQLYDITTEQLVRYIRNKNTVHNPILLKSRF